MGAISTPPFRTPLTTGAATTKDWWLFWRTLTELANGGLKMITFGWHPDRPVPEGWPNGALYVERDRSGVIYQNQDAVWQYLAGTMWNSIVPDNRPTDLGVNDAGFDYRTTDPPPREWIWSGTAWVEIASAQTPWASDIDGALHSLLNVNQVDAQSYLVAGLQVVGARLAAIAFASVSATTVTQFAGATYTTNEQNMLTALKTSVNQLNSDVVNLQTAVNDVRNRLFVHGLTY